MFVQGCRPTDSRAHAEEMRERLTAQERSCKDMEKLVVRLKAQKEQQPESPGSDVSRDSMGGGSPSGGGVSSRVRELEGQVSRLKTELSAMEVRQPSAASQCVASGTHSYGLC